jgi:hypothetical protein
MPQIPAKEVVKGVPLAEPTIVEKHVDILMVGGGMGNCGAAYEACRWADKIGGISIMLLDKASLERSGAVAQGLSAINTYVGKEQKRTTTSAWSAPTSWVWSAKT